MTQRPARIELLAPARDAEVALQAIAHGADAVYMGGPTHGARAAASNSLDDLARVAHSAHQYGARLYVTLNTIIYDSELAQVERMAWDYWRIGVDALIVQDMGLLRMHLPPIALHASTQCDIRTPDKARFLAQCGFSQLVLPRELSAQQIRAVRQAVPDNVALEAFVHGALCVSFSGDCQASFVANGRSANRGECAQMCRMAYDLTDDQGRAIVRDKHLLSLRDLCHIDHLPELLQAGVTSLKIEGRLKDAAYVKNTVAAYSRALNLYIDAHPDDYERSSWGRSRISFTPELSKAFNRGFTTYFLHGRPAASVSMANFDTPKWVGEPVGTVERMEGRCVVARLSQPLANGDGLGYFDRNGRFAGFRLNRIEGNRLFPASEVSLAPGCALYRNRDCKRDCQLEGATAQRRIPVDMQLRAIPAGLALRLSAHGGAQAEATISCSIEPARSSQRQQRLRTLAKLGDSAYELRQCDDRLDDLQFVPASTLADLRRTAVERLDSAIRATHRYHYRLPEDVHAPLPAGTRLSYHDNVANRLARQFYTDHGAESIEPALEAAPRSQRPDGPRTVMTTRYCLRRELGACLRQPGARKLPSPLFLQNKAARYRLEFDCDQCQMRLVAI